MLQPEPQSSEGCNTLSHSGLANINTWKRMSYRPYYIPSFQAQAVPNILIQLYAEMSTVASIQYNTIQLFYCFISFHMRHSQNTFINMFNINTKNDTGQPCYVKLAYLEYTAYVEVIIHSRIFPLYCTVIRPCLCQTRLS